MSGLLVAILLVFAIIFILIGWIVATRLIRKAWKKKHPLGTKIPFDYTEEDSFTLMGIIFIQRWVYGRKIISEWRYDMVRENYFRPNYKPTRAIIREEYWVDTKKKDLGGLGYKPVKGLHDSILWLGVKTYMIIKNGRAFEVPKDKDEKGNFLFPQDTAETLHDNASSNATQKFIAAMSKAATFGTMDLQTIIMIVIIGVGAIFGMHMMGIF